MKQSSSVDLREFASVDQAADHRSLFRALDEGKTTPGMRLVQADLTDELRLGSARSVLDIGCGLGGDVREMAARLPPDGTAVGIDASHVMVAEARRRTADYQGAVRPSYAVCSASALALPGNCFDRCRTQSVLLHLSNPQAAVWEAVRVLKPAGRAVAFEFDLGTAVLDHPDRPTTRTVLDYVADAAPFGWAGRALSRLYRKAGLADVRTHTRLVPNDYAFFAFTMRRPLARLVRDGVLSPHRAVEWLHMLEERHRNGDYTGGTTGFLVTGVKS
jgi:ubiquinone/menaquinone biosynthesis C-methylase UbiE